METNLRYANYAEYELVLILPMRNGNITPIAKANLQNQVLILPMRNGNTILSSTSSCVYVVLILPMRNGNIPFFTSFFAG